jgi:hypothetical protein
MGARGAIRCAAIAIIVAYAIAKRRRPRARHVRCASATDGAASSPTTSAPAAAGATSSAVASEAAHGQDTSAAIAVRTDTR